MAERTPQNLAEVPDVMPDPTRRRCRSVPDTVRLAFPWPASEPPPIVQAPEPVGTEADEPAPVEVSLEELARMAMDAMRPRDDATDDLDEALAVEDDEPVDDRGLYPGDEPEEVPAAPVTAVAHVTLDPTWAAAIDETTFHARVAVDCADRMATLARNRLLRPLRGNAEEERRILAQQDAILCTGPHGLEAVLEWHREVGTPWATWALAFHLASIEGREPLHTLLTVLQTLPSDAGEHAERAAEAIAVVRTPYALALARELLASEHPVARATGIEVLSHLRIMPTPDLVAWLATDDTVVRCAAIRSLLRNPEVVDPPDAVSALLSHDDLELVWLAARAITVWGQSPGYERVRREPALAQQLGARAAEIFVMTGEADDLDHLQRLVTTTTMTSGMLDAIARFGHPGVWSFLTHYLVDPLLQGAALEALVTLFGPLVEQDKQMDGRAWETAIGAARLSADLRYRRGKPWSPAVVAAECDGSLPLRAVEARVDEVRARSDLRVVPDVSRWTDALAPEMNAFVEQARAQAKHYGEGSWTWR